MLPDSAVNSNVIPAFKFRLFTVFVYIDILQFFYVQLYLAVVLAGFNVFISIRNC